MEGHSGSGKTAIIQHIAIKYKNEGWNVKPLHDVQGLMDTYLHRKKFQKKTLFILNDPFGQESFDEISYDRWATNMDALEDCLKTVKLLMSCRTSVLLDYRVKRLLKKSIIVKIDSDEFQLTEKEKRKIFNSYKGNKELSFIEGEIFKIGPYFPLLCKLYFSNNEYQQCGVRFFKEPVEVFKTEIESYRNANPVKYCALVLLVLFDNDLRVNDLTRNKLSLQKYKHALELFGIAGLAPYTIGDTLEFMKGFLVKKIDDSYQFYHDFVMEVTTFVFGTDYPRDLIECADIGFLRRRVRLKTCDGQYDPFTLYLNDTYKDQLGERLFNDILGIDFLEVVLNPCLKNEKVYKVFIGKLENYPEKLPQFLEKKTVEAEKQKKYQTINNSFLSNVTFVGLETQISPLFALITFCHTEISLQCLQTLQKLTPNVEYSSLFSAVCCNGSKDLLQLFSKDINTYLEEKWGSLFPIHIVSVFHNYEILQELLEIKEVDVNLRTDDEESLTPLILAAANETEENKHMQMQTLALLLKHGADINAYSKTGITPVFVACKNGKESIVTYLLAHGSIINYINTKDETSPLYIACQEGHDSIINLLLKYGAEIDLCQEGESLLYKACQKGHYSTVQNLLSNGADINFCTENGISPIIVARQEGHENIVQLLFKNGANIS